MKKIKPNSADTITAKFCYLFLFHFIYLFVFEFFDLFEF